MNTSIVIQNLKCGGCAQTIISKLAELESISDVTVDVEKSSVSFTFIKDNALVAAVKKLRALGYPSIDDKNSMAAKAISFVSCATGKMSKA